ncbi:hypothetical protein Pelo_8288 [Pelomyxa schiedti]|nr:hypothetical protein Pelo_8288 [Pelomyxa schiedti]
MTHEYVDETEFEQHQQHQQPPPEQEQQHSQDATMGAGKCGLLFDGDSYHETSTPTSTAVVVDTSTMYTDADPDYRAATVLPVDPPPHKRRGPPGGGGGTYGSFGGGATTAATGGVNTTTYTGLAQAPQPGSSAQHTNHRVQRRLLPKPQPQQSHVDLSNPTVQMALEKYRAKPTTPPPPPTTSPPQSSHQHQSQSQSHIPVRATSPPNNTTSSQHSHHHHQQQQQQQQQHQYQQQQQTPTPTRQQQQQPPQVVPQWAPGSGATGSSRASPQTTQPQSHALPPLTPVTTLPKRRRI